MASDDSKGGAVPPTAPSEPVAEPTPAAAAAKSASAEGSGKKTRRGGKKSGGAAAAPSTAAAAAGGDGTSKDTFGISPSDMTREQLLRLLGQDPSAASTEKKHKFWDTQPVPKISETVADCGPIDTVKSPSDVRATPYPLPTGFEWSTVNVDDEEELRELYTLLTENYVEDDDNMFRFDYSAAFLKWALTPTGFIPDWLVGLRRSKTGALMAFIAGIPVQCQVYGEKISMCEINFLCVHKKLREKRLAPVLIKEVTRRVNITDVWQAVYTAGVVLPKPVSACGYFHRPLNPKKLVEVGFSRTTSRMTLPRMIRLHKVPTQPSIQGIRPMTPEDVPVCHKMLCEFLTKFDLYLHFESEAEFAHWLLPREGVVNSYVVDGQDGVSDFFSFYHLPSSVIGNAKHDKLNAVYAFYTVPKAHTLLELMRDALVMAKSIGADVFNALDLQDNAEFLSELRFGPGDGKLQYYLYNWKCPQMPANKVGIVML